MARRLPSPEEYVYSREERVLGRLQIPKEQMRSAKGYYRFREEDGLKMAAAYGPDDVELFYFTDFSPVRTRRLSHDEARRLVSLQAYIARVLLLLAGLAVIAAWLSQTMSFLLLILVAVAALVVAWAIALAAVPLAQRWYVSRRPFGTPPAEFANTIAAVEAALVEEARESARR